MEDLFESSAQTRSFIIDAEVVAIDPTTGALKTFQELSNRARKDVKLDEVKVSVCVFAFDLMYLDNQVSIPCRRDLTCLADPGVSRIPNRFFWGDPSGSAVRCFGPAFLRIHPLSTARRGSITLKASRARPGEMPWRIFGKRL